MNKETIQARRAAGQLARARLRARLAQGPVSPDELPGHLGMLRNDFKRFLRSMAEMGEIERDGDGNWRLVKPGTFAGERMTVAQRRKQYRALQAPPDGGRVVPARQIGMRRDPLVAALFGPSTH